MWWSTKGAPENKVADALSRIPHVQLLSLAVSSVQSDLMEKLKQHWLTDTLLQQIIQEIQENEDSHPHFKWHQGQLTRKGKLVVGGCQEIKQYILDWMHSSHQGGHSGVEVTLRNIKTLFYCPKMK